MLSWYHGIMVSWYGPLLYNFRIYLCKTLVRKLERKTTKNEIWWIIVVNVLILSALVNWKCNMFMNPHETVCWLVARLVNWSGTISSHTFMHVCIYLCMYVCMYVFKYVYTYICMFVCICLLSICSMYIYLSIHPLF